MSLLSAPHFHNEKAAFEYLESVLWQDGPECPHCGVCDRASKMKGKASVRLAGGAVRRAELHWYEAHGIGKKEIKRKRYLE